MPAGPACLVTLAVLLALPSACRLLPTARPEATRFYTLSTPIPEQGLGDGLAVGLGPIHFPGYLDQAQLVTRVDGERIAFAPSERWAGSLRAQFERALSLRLMTLLDTNDVASFPWWPGRRIDATVEVTVLAFETDASGQARLDALWKVKDGRGQRVLESGNTSLREPIEGGGTEQSVAALDRALASLAASIAADVQRAVR
jgi:uncharacterized lipoprotein YmbA